MKWGMRSRFLCDQHGPLAVLGIRASIEIAVHLDGLQSGLFCHPGQFPPIEQPRNILISALFPVGLLTVIKLESRRPRLMIVRSSRTARLPFLWR